MRVKRKDLLARLRGLAGDAAVDFGLVREGANHSIFGMAGRNIVIPRRAEIAERTAASILKTAEAAIEAAKGSSS